MVSATQLKVALASSRKSLPGSQKAHASTSAICEGSSPAHKTVILDVCRFLDGVLVPSDPRDHPGIIIFPHTLSLLRSPAPGYSRLGQDPFNSRLNKDPGTTVLNCGPKAGFFF